MEQNEFKGMTILRFYVNYLGFDVHAREDFCSILIRSYYPKI